MSTLRPKCPPQPTECHRQLSALPGGREPSASHSKRRAVLSYTTRALVDSPSEPVCATRPICTGYCLRPQQW
eukprot:2170504-Rhodomonas_salina.1